MANLWKDTATISRVVEFKHRMVQTCFRVRFCLTHEAGIEQYEEELIGHELYVGEVERRFLGVYAHPSRLDFRTLNQDHLISRESVAYLRRRNQVGKPRKVHVKH